LAAKNAVGKVEEKVEKRVNKARKNVASGINMGLKTGERLVGNIPNLMSELMHTLEDHELEVSLNFNKLTLDGSISKKLSFNKKK